MNLQTASPHQLLAALTELALAWSDDGTLPADPAQQRLYQQLRFALDGRFNMQVEIVRAPGTLGLYFPGYPPGYDATCLEFEFARAAITAKASGPAYARALAKLI